MVSAASIEPWGAEQVLRIRVQEMACAIDLTLVERVFQLVAMQHVLGGPAYLVGLMNYHGESVAVVDLGLWFGRLFGSGSKDRFGLVEHSGTGVEHGS